MLMSVRMSLNLTCSVPLNDTITYTAHLGVSVVGCECWFYDLGGQTMQNLVLEMIGVEEKEGERQAQSSLHCITVH